MESVLRYTTCCVSAVAVEIYGLIGEWSLCGETRAYTGKHKVIR